MEKFVGKPICQKVAIGPVFYIEENQAFISEETVEDEKAERIRFENARKMAAKQLKVLSEKAKNEVGEAEAAIFEMHALMLEDFEYCDSVCEIISVRHMCAEYAVKETGERFYRMFDDMEDEYIKARAADIRDLSERLLSILTGQTQDMWELLEPVILVAEDLSPSQTVQMDRSKLLGFVTRLGSSNSHTAILARTMNIPALVGVDIQKSWHNRMAIVDGYEGTLTLDPDEAAFEKAKADMAGEAEKMRRLLTLKNKEAVTKGGRRIQLFANIGNVSDADAALLNAAEGIGMFRSEFLYLEAADFPTEEEQLAAYRAVAEKMADKKVIIRTMDIGADKQAEYFQLEKEENPAMGYRAIRICLTRKEIFKTQLRAILRASAFGRISVMFPMIISVDEVRAAKALLLEAKKELKEQKLPYADIEIGIMIETPAAVMISEELAGEVDFFSIGTNDLTQYTLAVDRQNSRLEDFYDPHHPAVLKMIQMVIENGHRGGIWVGICGELAADTRLTETFLRMGVDELSVSPGLILSVKERIRESYQRV